MERKYGDKFILPVMLCELVGTSLLMLAANLAGDDTLVVALAYFALVVCTYEVSGGHLNPAISIGVYIAEKRYVHNLLFMIFIIVAQVVGALFALGLGYLLRVTVSTTTDFGGAKYLEPNVYASAPPLLISTDGMPSYGQIMLSETIGTFLLVLTSLSARGFIKQGPTYNMAQGAITMAVGLAAVQRMFRETSGGVANPAVAVAKIIWQEFTLPVDLDNANSQWTYEYAASFFIGPISGAMLAGATFNLIKHTAFQMDTFKKEPKSDDSQSNVSHSDFQDSSFRTDNSMRTPPPTDRAFVPNTTTPQTQQPFQHYSMADRVMQTAQSTPNIAPIKIGEHHKIPSTTSHGGAGGHRAENDFQQPSRSAHY